MTWRVKPEAAGPFYITSQHFRLLPFLYPHLTSFGQLPKSSALLLRYNLYPLAHHAIAYAPLSRAGQKPLTGCRPHRRPSLAANSTLQSFTHPLTLSRLSLSTARRSRAPSVAKSQPQKTQSRTTQLALRATTNPPSSSSATVPLRTASHRKQASSLPSQALLVASSATTNHCLSQTTKMLRRRIHKVSHFFRDYLDVMLTRLQ